MRLSVYTVLNIKRRETAAGDIGGGGGDIYTVYIYNMPGPTEPYPGTSLSLSLQFTFREGGDTQYTSYICPRRVYPAPTTTTTTPPTLSI